MKIRITVGFILNLCLAIPVYAQIDSTLLKQDSKIKQTPKLNMDAVYNRPFLTMDKLPVALGGYMEVNWQHIGTDGVSDGHQFQFRRLTLFVSSSITKQIKFLTEIEFEDGTKEIAIEFAAVDFEFHPMLNLRGGIVMNPIGAFNQNHDGPKWEFTDRPISATQMLPATWSNAGFGVYGKYGYKKWLMGYEFYLTNGFDQSIIENNQNKTYLPASKQNVNRFEESANGEMMVSGKVAVKNFKVGEIGLSYMGGVYNQYQIDGIVLDEKRRCDVFAVDLNAVVPKVNTNIIGELAWIFVDIPPGYTQQFGNKQWGGFLDIVQPVWKHTIGAWDNAVINLACRFEYVDWNIGKFNETQDRIGDELWSVMPAISFRPTSQTVLRLNYRFMKQRDVVGNPPATTAGFNFGVSTYF